MGDTTSAVPNPGSIEALHRGCTCPVIDNHHGEGVPSSRGRSFWIADGCLIHNARFRSDSSAVPGGPTHGG